jgi:hypothetical protein
MELMRWAKVSSVPDRQPTRMARPAIGRPGVTELQPRRGPGQKLVEVEPMPQAVSVGASLPRMRVPPAAGRILAASRVPLPKPWAMEARSVPPTIAPWAVETNNCSDRARLGAWAIATPERREVLGAPTRQEHPSCFVAVGPCPLAPNRSQYRQGYPQWYRHRQHAVPGRQLARRPVEVPATPIHGGSDVGRPPSSQARRDTTPERRRRVESPGPAPD